MRPRYVGRFAPSPTGLLHAGSLVAALASWLDARAHDGCWLVRIDDLDAPRNAPGAADAILAQLQTLGLVPDAVPVRQSERAGLYARALQQLVASGDAYPCACSRRDLELAASPAHTPRTRHAERIYPGTCRNGLGGRTPRSLRLRTARPDRPDGGMALIDWNDRRLGPLRQDVAASVGDFVLERADGIHAYQLAVVIDDAAQAVTDVVRGEDLAGNTARQILLQHRLGLPTPRYLHTPLVLDAAGEKLSKQTGAPALRLDAPVDCLRSAGLVLGVAVGGTTVAEWLAEAVTQWRSGWGIR
ncbi:MAG: tRNA glutamyl-Q(34) synthetase GluQRS [Pseudomonadota bacterium]|nr:tRNA glutamyl-Q(34) synthetase GluQRS [Pseudomonadota bacterium]